MTADVKNGRQIGKTGQNDHKHKIFSDHMMMMFSSQLRMLYCAVTPVSSLGTLAPILTRESR